MIDIQEITEYNFNQVINLEVQEEQKLFVSSNAHSLAECYLYRNNNDVFPYAISVDGIVVGFLMVYSDDDEKSMTIWRMMIDKNHQSKGYGKQAMLKIEHMIKQQGKYECIYTSYRADNVSAKYLYEKIGYEYDRINEYGEIVLKKSIISF